MTTVLITTIVCGEIKHTTSVDCADLHEALAFAGSCKGAGRIVCVRKGKKIILVD